MPKVLDLNGRKVFWYSDEHDPPHVHVTSGGCQARFELNCPTGPAKLSRLYRPPMPLHECRNIARELTPHIPALCQKWKARP